MHGYYIDLLRAFKGERLNSVFSPDGTLISASAAPQCGVVNRTSCGRATWRERKPAIRPTACLSLLPERGHSQPADYSATIQSCQSLIRIRVRELT